jgi:hypothetical protein
MPRHPPCALTHLTTPRCSHPLCNTQHTTTPQNTRRHHTEKPCVRPTKPGMAPRTTPHRCPLRTQQRAKPPATTTGTGPNLQRNVPPSHTHAPHPTAGQRLIRHGISERRPSPHQPTHPKATPTNQDRAHHQQRWLLRKEVIQPHLPVRLPCYDFVPIASPTFDDSPQQAG